MNGRCETCRHWNPDVTLTMGVCGAIHEDSGLMTEGPSRGAYLATDPRQVGAATERPGGVGLDLWTPREFGCAAHQAKEST